MCNYRSLSTRILYGYIFANYGSFCHILFYIAFGHNDVAFANVQKSSPHFLTPFVPPNTANLSIHEGELAQLSNLPPMRNATKSRKRRSKPTKHQTRDRYAQATMSDNNTRQYNRFPGRTSSGTISAFNQDRVPLVRLTRDILASHRYDVRVRPVTNHTKTLLIHISMSLYQIIDVNEPAQNVKMNVWMIQKWRDESLHWDPREYAMINTTILPHNVLWVPDTYLYNSVVMTADETERYMNIRADSLFWEGKRGANMSFLYPAIYTVTCRLNIRYFPYDQQNCTLTIGSWTNSKSALDYVADDHVNMASFIQNEEWEVMSFRIFRHEYKYACCPEPWVILEASIILRRKPLYYVINLIIPTSIITLVAITGFFTPASTADDRTEKINLGITTLLAMSILMLMVSDAMPTTSEFVPLIAWFYLSIIIIISIGTFLTSVILSIQGRRQYGELPPLRVRYWVMVRIRELLCIRVPPQLALIWEELNDHPFIAYHEYFLKKSEFARTQTNNNKHSAKRVAKEKSYYRHDDVIDENVVVLCGDSARQPTQNRKSSSLKNRKQRPGRGGELKISAPQMPVNSIDNSNSIKRGRNLVLPSALQRTSSIQKSSRARSNWRRVRGAVTAHLQQQAMIGAAQVDGTRRQAPSELHPAARNSLTVPMIDMASPCATPSLPTTPLLPTPSPQLNSGAENLARHIDLKRASDAPSMIPLNTPPPLPPRTPLPPEPGALSQPLFRRKSIMVVPPPGHQQSLGARSRQDSTWDTAMSAMGMTTTKRKSGASATFVTAPSGLSPEVVEMRRRRQCSLEWEFVATILDRVFLILFTFTVISVTAALMVTGRVAQAHYQSIAEQLQ